MNPHYYCVIMAGGLGSRFWPVSRRMFPKQFLRFSRSGKSFLRLAYDRVEGLVPRENILVVSLGRYADLVRKDIPELAPDALLLEPHHRNTAPCIAYAAHTILRRDPEAVMVVLPSDQVIDDRDLYRLNLEGALEYASEHDVLITLGVVPTRPDPNFGYIQTEGVVEPYTPSKVKSFTEKPDKELAKVFIDSGEFLWNAGIFIWKVSAILDALAVHAPEIARLWEGHTAALGTSGEAELLEDVYSDMPRTSIDYAVMEKADNVITYPATFGWADLGNWDSFYEYLSGHDACSNAMSVAGKHHLKDVNGSVIYSNSSEKLIAVKGLQDFVVIDTDDILMICPRDEEKLREFISELAMPEFREYR